LVPSHSVDILYKIIPNTIKLWAKVIWITFASTYVYTVTAIKMFACMRYNAKWKLIISAKTTTFKDVDASTTPEEHLFLIKAGRNTLSVGAWLLNRLQ